MAFSSNGTLTTDQRTVNDSETWETQSDWEAYQSKNNTEVVNGSVQLSELVIPPSGVARYTFDDSDTQSGQAIDIWNSNNSSINGAITGLPGANQTYTTNEAYSFDGGENVQTPIQDTFSTFSWAAWVKPDNTNQNKTEIVSTRGAAGAGMRINGNDYGFYASSGTFKTITDSGGVTANTWSFLVAVLSSSQLLLYRDGNQVASTSFGTYSPENDIIIGQRADGGSNISGDVDDVRIYDKALSSTEVSDLYNTGTIL